jgi:transposase
MSLKESREAADSKKREAANRKKWHVANRKDQRLEKLQTAMKLRDAGHSLKVIKQATGLHPVTISRRYGQYKKNGMDAFEAKRRGRPKMASYILPLDLEFEIICDITHNSPDDLGLPFCLWGNLAIQALLNEHYQIPIPSASLKKILQRWDLNVDKPAPNKECTLHRWREKKRTSDRGSKKKYLELVQQARSEKAQIHWCYPRKKIFYRDPKCDLHNQMLAFRGEFNPVTTYAFTAVTNRGTAHYIVYRGQAAALTYIRFLERLAKTAGKRVYCIFQRFHLKDRSVLEAWIDKNQEKVKVFITQ